MLKKMKLILQIVSTIMERDFKFLNENLLFASYKVKLFQANNIRK